MKSILILLFSAISLHARASDCGPKIRNMLKESAGTPLACTEAGKFTFVLAQFPDSIDAEFAGISYFVFNSEMIDSGFKKALVESDTGFGEQVIAINCDKKLNLMCEFDSGKAKRIFFQVFVPPRAGHVYAYKLNPDGKLQNEIVEGKWFSDPGLQSFVSSDKALVSTLSVSTDAKREAPQKFSYKNGVWKTGN